MTGKKITFSLSPSLTDILTHSNLESTELSKAFAKQGLKIPIRNDGKHRMRWCIKR